MECQTMWDNGSILFVVYGLLIVVLITIGAYYAA